MRASLYRWPSAAQFGRTVPKTKFYEHASIGSTIKDCFVSDVRRITWAYKLAESTINLPGSVEVPEIQVFEIGAKEEDVAEGVLAAIDKAVRTPIIFEISRGEGTNGTIRMVAAHKQLGTGAPKLGPYFSTSWQPAPGDRTPLPAAIDLTSMYTALLQPLTPVASRAGEDVSEIVSRLTTVQSLEREVTALERKLRNEPQLNRKIELRQTLKTKQAMLVDLTSRTPSPATGDMN
ncbi:DUF4391 domain-containing protein [Blastococcus saxobsidens]|uniref:DUF4391 domain-containing protein n=1 Tax=Blastococcus saxobsidens TaxID=138336 RepID=A0A6L9W6D5_9ACTN|nr:DUF4391 domain-containing protein [Blastococcus saxobsidens]NEK87656.1 DUF4391 domain-containing protein [Blastococcus saxobsidens]